MYHFFHSDDSSPNYHSFRRYMYGKKSSIVNWMSKVLNDISRKEIDAPFLMCFAINEHEKLSDEKDKLGRNKKQYIDEQSIIMYILPEIMEILYSPNNIHLKNCL